VTKVRETKMNVLKAKCELEQGRFTFWKQGSFRVKLWSYKNPTKFMPKFLDEPLFSLIFSVNNKRCLSFQ